MNFLLIVLGFALLVLGGDYLLKSALGFANRFQIPKFVVGMTVVSFATSAPELIVSVRSALSGHPDIAIGNVIGSNIANLALVLSITVIISSIYIKKNFYKLDWPIMMFSSVLLVLFIAFDGYLDRIEGGVLFLLLIIVIVFLLKSKKNLEEETIPIISTTLLKDVLFLLIGAFGLWSGAELVINGAVAMAKQAHISERVIGITVVSFGTSIPELAASIIAVLKKEKAISLGNLIGSNMFNVLAVIGVTALIKPISIIDDGIITSDIFWMLGVSFLVLLLVFIPSKMKLGRKEGLILLLFYILFVINTFC